MEICSLWCDFTNVQKVVSEKINVNRITHFVNKMKKFIIVHINHLLYTYTNEQ